MPITSDFLSNIATSGIRTRAVNTVEKTVTSIVVAPESVARVVNVPEVAHMIAARTIRPYAKLFETFMRTHPTGILNMPHQVNNLSIAFWRTGTSTPLLCDLQSKSSEKVEMERRSKHGRIGIVSVVQIALFAFMLAFTFAGPLMTPARAATTYYVNIVDFAFSPATITIQPGDSVQWNNTVSTGHSSTSDLTSTEVWDSLVLSLGQTYTHQFSNAGSFSYHCSQHPTMHGTVIVGAIPEFSSLAFVMIGLMVLVVGLSAVIRRR